MEELIKELWQKRKKRCQEKKLWTRYPNLLSTGGYFLNIDHAMPPDVPFENYLCYLELLKKVSSLTAKTVEYTSNSVSRRRVHFGKKKAIENMGLSI